MNDEARPQVEVRVKICGTRTPEAARAAVRAGADAVGLVFAESPRRVTVEEASLAASAARDEAASAGRSVEAWGVVVNEPVERLAEIARAVPLDVIQLHGDETPEYARELGNELPQRSQLSQPRVASGDSQPALEGEAGEPAKPASGLDESVASVAGSLRLVRAVRVRDSGALEEIDRLWATGLFGAILLDSFDESARGGTGKTFDWDVAREAARRFPVVLAGGLTPGNVAEAVRRVRPRWVNTSSGVESSPGVKDAALVERFVREARSAQGDT